MWCQVPHWAALALACLVWAAGALACGEMASRMLIGEGTKLADKDLYPALGVAIALGALLGATLFRRLADDNVSRIDALSAPRLYQAFRLRFWAFLILGDGVLVVLTHYYCGGNTCRLIMGSSTLSVCLALSISLPVFFARGLKSCTREEGGIDSHGLKTSLLVLEEGSP